MSIHLSNTKPCWIFFNVIFYEIRMISITEVYRPITHIRLASHMLKVDDLNLIPLHLWQKQFWQLSHTVSFILHSWFVFLNIGSKCPVHYDEVIMGAMASQITSLTIVYSTVYSGADQRKHQSSASLASVWGIHRWPVNSPHKWPVTRKIFPFHDVIMRCDNITNGTLHYVTLSTTQFHLIRASLHDNPL